MREGNSNVRWIAGLVLLSFTWIVLGLVTEMPLGAATGRTDDKAAAAQIDQPTNGESGALEKVGPTPTIGKKKKFPWLLAAAGAVVVGAAVYYLFFHKPKYELTVELSEGATGTPAAGTHRYKKGDIIPYEFRCASGYKNLTVLLDGAPVAVTGSVEMKQDHTLKASADKFAEFTLSVQVDAGVTGTPAAGTYRYMEGTSIDFQYSLKAGYCDLLVKKNGDTVHSSTWGPASGTIAMTQNLTLSVSSQVLDIRGKWRVRYYHGTFTMVALFSGTLTAGTVSILEGSLAGEAGTYQVTGNQVSFDIPVKYSYYVYKYQGSFDTRNSLSGTYYVETDPPGSPSDFNAVRIE
jgi:hypothetical protein